MGLSLQIFLVRDDNSVQRLPLARYERLLRGDSVERLPEFAGKRVRYAEVAVELVQRKPVAVRRIQYFVLTFGSDGQIDPIEREREKRLAVEALPPYAGEDLPRPVVDARHRFAKKRFDREYRWTPSPETERKILNAIFAKG